MNYQKGQGDPLLWVLFALVALLFIGGTRLIPKADQPATAPKEGALGVFSGKDEEKVITVAKIMEDPNIYNGLPVTVDADIRDWVTRRAFTIRDNPEPLGITAGDGLLVIRKEEYTLPDVTPPGQISLGETAHIRVRGTVQYLNMQALANTWGVALDAGELAKFENKPVIVADTVVEK